MPREYNGGPALKDGVIAGMMCEIMLRYFIEKSVPNPGFSVPRWLSPFLPE